MRTCCLCRSEDHPVILGDMCSCPGGDDLAGHATGCLAIQHFVTRDIKAHAGKIPLAMQRKGWTELGNFQGKLAIHRLLCRTCIRKQDDVIEIEQYKKKCGEEAESSREMDMYAILCS